MKTLKISSSTVRTTSRILSWSMMISLIGLGCKSINDEGVKEAVETPTELYGEINISGAHALYPLVKAWSEEFMHEYPQVNIRVTKTSTGQGITDVMSDKTDLAMMTSEYITDMGIPGPDPWMIGVARSAVVPIINQNNPYHQALLTRGLTKEQVTILFTSPVDHTWGEVLGQERENLVSVYVRDELSGATDVWAKYLKCRSSDLKGKVLPGDESMIEKIRHDTFSIGYCNSIYAYDLNTDHAVPGICVLPIDFNGNGRIDAMEKFHDEFSIFRRSVCIGKYTCDLCITLYIISKEKPSDEATLAFLKWILKEGQQTIEKNGYARLPGFALDNSLLKLL